MSYTCPKCNKLFDHKSHFTIHLNKKKSCSEDVSSNSNTDTTNNKFSCQFCDKTFTRKYTLDRHLLASCKLKNISIIKTNDKIKSIEEKMNKLIEENAELKDNIQKLSKAKSGKVTNHYSNNIVNVGSINTINNTINNTLVIKFGHEDIYKLNDDDRNKILFEKGLDPILESIERIHFNNNLPDQQNIHLTNINSKYVNLFNGTRWEKQPLSATTDMLLENHAFNLSLMVDECDASKKPKIKNSVNKSIQLVNDYLKLENDESEYTDDKKVTLRNEMSELKENVKLKLYNKTQEIQKDKIVIV
jgi:hypothetical protein